MKNCRINFFRKRRFLNPIKIKLPSKNKTVIFFLLLEIKLNNFSKFIFSFNSIKAELFSMDPPLILSNLTLLFISSAKFFLFDFNWSFNLRRPTSSNCFLNSFASAIFCFWNVIAFVKFFARALNPFDFASYIESCNCLIVRFLKLMPYRSL